MFRCELSSSTSKTINKILKCTVQFSKCTIFSKVSSIYINLNSYGTQGICNMDKNLCCQETIHIIKMIFTLKDLALSLKENHGEPDAQV